MTASDSVETVPGVTLKAQVTPEFAAILTPEALTFLATLHREFNRPPRPTPGEARRTPGSARRWSALRLPAGDARDPRERMDRRADPA